MNEGEVVGGELVITSCHAPTLLDLVEKSFDQISSPVKIRAEAECLFAVPLWRDVCPSAALVGERSDPIGGQPAAVSSNPDLIRRSSQVFLDQELAVLYIRTTFRIRLEGATSDWRCNEQDAQIRQSLR